MYFNILRINVKGLTVVAADQSTAPGHAVCDQPADPQLFPHHRGSLQLHAASTLCGPLFLQDDPHPGLYRLPPHHERPAADHGKHHPPHKSVFLPLCVTAAFKKDVIPVHTRSLFPYRCLLFSVPRSDGSQSAGDHFNHQFAEQQR